MQNPTEICQLFLIKPKASAYLETASSGYVKTEIELAQ